MRKTLVVLASLGGGLLLLYALVYGAIITCTGGPCVGTPEDDVMNETAADSTIYGLGGDDTINVNENGTNLIFGGPGDDTVIAINNTQDGTLTIFGEDGDDFIDLSAVVSNVSGDETHVVYGGRGGDTILGTNDGTNATTGIAITVATDGPGRDTIIGLASPITVFFVGDNEPDTFRGGAGTATVILDRNSGRDVIQCGSGGGTVFLNGNNKAVDPFGNNLRQAALLGGTAQSNCTTIVP